MNLSDAAETWLLLRADRCSPTTVKTERVLLRQFRRFIGGESRVTDIQADDVRAYLRHHRDRGLSPHTIRRHLATISSLYNWLCSPDVDLAERDPTDQVVAPKLPSLQSVALEDDEARALVKACDHSNLPRRDKSLLLFMLDTAARASEVCSVRIPDVGFKSGKVLLRETKGDKERYVFMGRRALAAALIYFRESRGQPAIANDDHLWLSANGYPIDRGLLRQMVNRRSEDAGIRSVSPHMLRHTASCNLARAGASTVAIQRILGHSDISTTATYLRSLNTDDIQRVAQRCSPVDNLRL